VQQMPLMGYTGESFEWMQIFSRYLCRCIHHSSMHQTNRRLLCDCLSICCSRAQVSNIARHKTTQRTVICLLTADRCAVTSFFRCRYDSVIMQGYVAALYRVGRKNKTVLRVDNFATDSDSKACDVSKVSEFV